MKTQMTLAAAALLLGTAVSPSLAQEKIKLGVVVTLSGPAAALGQQVRDGFALAREGSRRQDGRPRCRGDRRR